MAPSEDELRAITIGELDRLDGPVVLRVYDPAWPELFARAERRIRTALRVQSYADAKSGVVADILARAGAPPRPA